MIKYLIHSETAGDRSQPTSCPLAAPVPQSGMVNCFGPHGIKHYVAAHFEKVALFQNQDPFKAPLKQMSDSVVASIESLSVNDVAGAYPWTNSRPAFRSPDNNDYPWVF